MNARIAATWAVLSVLPNTAAIAQSASKAADHPQWLGERSSTLASHTPAAKATAAIARGARGWALADTKLSVRRKDSVLCGVWQKQNLKRAAQEGKLP
jgi:hypothetical protein